MSQFLRSNAWVIAVVAIVIAAAFYFVDPAPPHEITLATGLEGGAYDEFGRKLATRLNAEGLTVHLRPTKGSVENLSLLQATDNDVSIALVQSGIVRDGETRLRSLGALFHEPLWVFTRRDFNLPSLHDLRGRKVAIGPEGSGTRPVALRVFELNGFPDGVETVPLGGDEAYAALRNREVDVAMFVASPQSPFIRKLLVDPEVKFQGLNRVPAYQAAFPRLTTVAIGEGQLDLARNLPANERTLLSSVVTLVVNERFYSGFAPLVLQAAQDILRDGGALERPGEFPAPRPGDFPLLAEAEHYHRNGPPFLMRILPFWVATVLVRVAILLVPLIVVLVPLFRIAPPLYQWQTRRKIFRWYRHLREVDQRLHSGTIRETVEADLHRLRELQTEILAVQVPLSYADELYELHLHIDWVIRRLEGFAQASPTEAN